MVVVVSNRVTPTAGGKAELGRTGGRDTRRALQRAAASGSVGAARFRNTRRPRRRRIAADGHSPMRRSISRGRITSEYYIGYANRVLWPLFHYRPSSLVEFSRRRSSAAICASTASSRAPWRRCCCRSDFVWVHDYHLMPLGRRAAQAGPTQPIGFFLHTPFPAAELLPRPAEPQRAHARDVRL